MKRLLLIALSSALLIAGTSAPAAATKPDGQDFHKVTICHALPASADHDYNRITVDIASTGYVKGGHWVPGGNIGDKHADGGDIIPPYMYDGQSYPGQNWTAKGRAIYNNGCKVPPPPPRIEKLNPKFTVRVCGDPRLILTINNRRSTVPVTYRFWTINGRGIEKTFAKTVPAGTRDVLMPRWVKGRSVLRWTLSAPGFVTPAVVHSMRLPAATHWGQGYCPANLAAAKTLARNY